MIVHYENINDEITWRGTPRLVSIGFGSKEAKRAAIMDIQRSLKRDMQVVFLTRGRRMIDNYNVTYDWICANPKHISDMLPVIDRISI